MRGVPHEGLQEGEMSEEEVLPEGRHQQGEASQGALRVQGEENLPQPTEFNLSDCHQEKVQENHERQALQNLASLKHVINHTNPLWRFFSDL